jgi:hypothetical protein
VQLRVVRLYVRMRFPTCSTPSRWVAFTTALVVYPTPWQSPQERPECSPCSPVEGGRPWQEVQPTWVVLVQLTVAPWPLLAPPENRPWQ